MSEEMVTITKKEYNRLLREEAQLYILVCRGVDNWEGYCSAPDRDDYATQEEYEAALEDACNGF